jgi:hypothetical protein
MVHRRHQRSRFDNGGLFKTRFLHSRLFWSDVQVPVNAAIFAITLLKPLVTFGEVMAVELHIVSIFTIISTDAVFTYEASRSA